MRSATLIGGAQDGLRFRLEGADLPATIGLNGELYRQAGSNRYVVSNGVGWGQRRRFDSVAREAFLQAVAAGSSVAEATKSIGFSVSPVYVALKKDSAFRLAYDAAQKAKRSRRQGDDSVLLTVRVDREKLALLEDQARRYGVPGGARGVLELPSGTTFHEPVAKPWLRPNNLERKMLKGDGLPS
jgi:hypothetical protein